jgi:predicted Zn-dependent protease
VCYSLVRLTIIIDDYILFQYLDTLGDLFFKHTPTTEMKFRFYLIDLPDVNAFSIAGGRVYVSRKMVVLTRSDDELAGILAHELGHIVTHQSAIDTTRRFRDALGITQVGDRADIFASFHQYLENEARKTIHSGLNDDKDQFMAFARERTRNVASHEARSTGNGNLPGSHIVSLISVIS